MYNRVPPPKAVGSDSFVLKKSLEFCARNRVKHLKTQSRYALADDVVFSPTTVWREVRCLFGYRCISPPYCFSADDKTVRTWRYTWASLPYKPSYNRRVCKTNGLVSSSFRDTQAINMSRGDDLKNDLSPPPIRFERVRVFDIFAKFPWHKIQIRRKYNSWRYFAS